MAEAGLKDAEGNFRDWLEAIDQHGPLTTRDIAAAALAVSRQCVHQLISTGLAARAVSRLGAAHARACAPGSYRSKNILKLSAAILERKKEDKRTRPTQSP